MDIARHGVPRQSPSSEGSGAVGLPRQGLAISRMGGHSEELQATRQSPCSEGSGAVGLPRQGLAISRIGGHSEELQATRQSPSSERPGAVGLPRQGLAISTVGGRCEELQAARQSPCYRSALVDTLRSIGREGNTSGSGCHAAKRTLPVLLISLSSPGSRRCRLEDIRRGGKAIQDFACPLTSKQISFISSGAFHVIIWTIP